MLQCKESLCLAFPGLSLKCNKILGVSWRSFEGGIRLRRRKKKQNWSAERKKLRTDTRQPITIILSLALPPSLPVPGFCSVLSAGAAA